MAPPPAAAGHPTDAGELCDGWQRKESRSHPGQVYFIHPESGKTQWEAPLKKPRLAQVSAEEPHGSSVTPELTGSSEDLDGGLFAGLPEAHSTTCTPKKSQAIPESAPKPLMHVRVLHLLKKHAGSRRPSSWREKVITRSSEEAIFMLKELRKRILACSSETERRAEFEKLARKESDCVSAHEGGSLGRFKRGTMQPAFEQAAFSLAVNELSGVVTTDSGVHLILRLE